MDSETKLISIRMPVDLVKVIDRLAKNTNRSVVINRYLREAVNMTSYERNGTHSKRYVPNKPRPLVAAAARAAAAEKNKAPGPFPTADVSAVEESLKVLEPRRPVGRPPKNIKPGSIADIALRGSAAVEKPLKKKAAKPADPLNECPRCSEELKQWGPSLKRCLICQENFTEAQLRR